MRIELAVFDMAGTTVSEGGTVYAALRETLADYGLRVGDEAIATVRGTDKREALRKLIEISGPERGLLDHLAEINSYFVTRLLKFYGSDPSVTEIDGTSEVFIRLKEMGVKVALNTGFSREIAQVLIDRLGWERGGLIDGSVTSDEVEQGRPHQFMIRHLMSQFGIADPLKVAKTGDAPADLLEGYNAGCGLNIGVLYGSSRREELEVHPHHHLVERISEIPTLIVRANGD